MLEFISSEGMVLKRVREQAKELYNAWYEYAITHAGGTLIQVETNYQASRDSDGDVRHFILLTIQYEEGQG